MIGMIPKTSL